MNTVPVITLKDEGELNGETYGPVYFGEEQYGDRWFRESEIQERFPSMELDII